MELTVEELTREVMALGAEIRGKRALCAAPDVGPVERRELERDILSLVYRRTAAYRRLQNALRWEALRKERE